MGRHRRGGDTIGLVLTVAETARELRVHPLTVRRAIKRGDLPSVLVGRRVLVPIAGLESWLAAASPLTMKGE
jgi:excisionase family DNA binding protein